MPTTMSGNHDLNEFAHLWSTERNRYALLEARDGWLILDVEKRQPVVIEDARVYEAVVEQMLDAGVRVVTRDSLRPRPPDERT